jgi:hypothetical protein
MSKIDAMSTFATAVSWRSEYAPRFSRSDLVVAAAIVAIAAALVAIPLLFDVSGLSAALNIAEGQYP